MGDVVQLPVRSAPAPEEADVEPLWRESVGRALREERLASGKRLVDVAEEAGVSPQYLSEVERGRKEPSSEMIAALAGALDTTLADLTTQVTEDLRERPAQSPVSPGAPVALAMAA
jgi:transcriptional regulator with XRE-family HTH domain